MLSETRPGVLVRHTQALMHAHRLSWESLAVDVVRLYHERTPPAQRAVRFHVGGDAFRDARANAQLLRRFADPDAAARLPAEIEEAWVLALPEPWQSRAIEDLARRYGLLGVRAPQATDAPAAVGIATLFREAGEAGEAVAKMLEDNGRIGPEDAPLAEAALRELDDVVRAALSLQARVRAGVSGETRTPGRVPRPALARVASR